MFFGKLGHPRFRGSQLDRFIIELERDVRITNRKVIQSIEDQPFKGVVDTFNSKAFKLWLNVNLCKFLCAFLDINIADCSVIVTFHNQLKLTIRGCTDEFGTENVSQCRTHAVHTDGVTIRIRTEVRTCLGFTPCSYRQVDVFAVKVFGQSYRDTTAIVFDPKRFVGYFDIDLIGMLTTGTNEFVDRVINQFVDDFEQPRHVLKRLPLVIQELVVYLASY
ncbi:hypothetical protein D3C71_1382610 [compost metagenome]